MELPTRSGSNLRRRPKAYSTNPVWIRRGFTLIEMMMIVMAIIVILDLRRGAVLPEGDHAREGKRAP